MASDPLARFHETWLGLAQPYEGLVVSIPVLVDAQIGAASDAPAYEAFRALAQPEGRTERRVVRDLPRFYREVLGFSADMFAAPTPDHALYVAEGPETLTPSWVLAPRGDAGGACKALGVELGPEVSLDKPDASAAWQYPPTAKLERLLRHAKVPVGLLTNGRELRLVYAPEGESAGHLTFRFDDAAKSDGKPLFDAMRALVSARSFYGARAGASLRELCEASRSRQLDVTQALAKQVLDALEVLVHGFGRAEERDKLGALEAAREEGTLTRGLLTLLLRLVFLLYAEDRGLLLTEHPLFDGMYSLFGLFARLTADRQAFPDSMGLRFGAYGELVALFRAVFFGVNVPGKSESGPLFMPARKGELFDPERFPFLEGWLAGGAPTDDEARSEARVPTLDDGTVLGVLERLVVFEGQRLSYATLDVEQIGSVYEGLMGFDVHVAEAPSVRIGPSRAWVSVAALAELPARERARFLQDETGLAKAQAAKLAEAFSAAIEGLTPSPSPTRGEGSQKESGLEVLAAARVKGTEVALPGTLLLQPGPERRRTSSHYTPRSLSAPIVRRTLEPLLRVLGENPTADQLLSLKVCDPAMGSGAFLVEACRVLGAEVEAAWRRQETADSTGGPLRGSVRGKASQPDASSRIEVGDLTLEARRRVAETCLYGVDKNPDAVILAKLSLWLVTLAKDKPFSFLDHALKSGDSLVGLSLAQIEAFTYAPVTAPADTASKPGNAKAKRAKHDPLPGQLTLFTSLIEGELREAISLRHRLERLSEHSTPEAVAEQAWLAQDSDDALRRVKRIADVIVGAFFAHGKDKDRLAELQRRKDRVDHWLATRDIEPPAEIVEWQRALHEKVNVFHWPLEFPEVFWPGRPDPLDGGKTEEPACFDAFVGNPPFLAGGAVSGCFGNEYKDWLIAAHPGSHGNGDLSAHFLRRADRLLGHHGCMGFIGTNTLAQGDTAATGLAWLVEHGVPLYSVVSSMAWPGNAAVTICVVHLCKGARFPEVIGPPILDGEQVSAISGQLRAGAQRQPPSRLALNEEMFSLGAKIYGQGFVLDDAEVAHLSTHEGNRSRLFPYIGGEEVNSSPTQTYIRWVISFGDMSLSEAEAWPTLLQIVRERVKPERDKLRDDQATAKLTKERWWRFWAPRTEFFDCVRSLQRCLVSSQVTKHLMFSYQPTDRIFAHTLYVFPLEPYTSFAVLQSRIHEPWARLLSSSMKTDLRYSASDCFATFPFPRPDPRTILPAVEAAGEAFYAARAEYMRCENVGLTVTYNRLKDPTNDTPEVASLRGLTEAMDRAVLEAYGWGELEVPPYCAGAGAASADEDRAAQKAFADAVVERLYALNAERAKAEARGATGAGKTGKGGKKK